MKVKNGKVIRKLTLRKIAAERSRSIVAALAIGLTALLFTSLFTILLSVNDGFQQSNFRQAGGYSHGSFKSLAAEEVDILKNAPGIARYGVRQYAGQLGGEYKNRIYTEVDYVDASDAEMMYSAPTTGSLPAEGTDEAAADSQFLAVIGVEPELGARFTVPVEVNGVTLEETSTLSGWWEAEPGSNFSFLLVPQSRAAELLEKAGEAGADRYENAGKWSLDVMLEHPADIDGEMEKILESCGYQGDDPSAEGYISYGVNWGYTQAQVTSGDTLGILGAGAAGAIFIALTGYLIIYNVFQIAVGEDIRFNGLLKTIGATRRQLGRMVRLQALVLCCAGLPAGLLIGWVIGYLIAPTVTRELVSAEAASANPVIFLFAAVFALLTVLISCRRPARLAGSVSPVEAVRYTEGAAYTRKKGRKAKKNGRFFLTRMARANLGRSRRKTVLTVLSLSLALVLFNVVVTFTGGFSMDRYLSRFSNCDYLLANASQLGMSVSSTFSPQAALPESIAAAAEILPGFGEGGRIYAKNTFCEAGAPEEYIRANDAAVQFGIPGAEEALDNSIAGLEEAPDGKLFASMKVYGMEDFPLSQLTVVDGDLSKLSEPGYIAAVYQTDDYEEPYLDSSWTELGDQVTIRYVTEYEYYNGETGEIYGEDDEIPVEVMEKSLLYSRAAAYTEKTYTVAAHVTVPFSFSFRYYGNDEYVLSAENFLADTGSSDIIYYAMDAAEGADETLGAAVEELMSGDPTLGYEDKGEYASMFTGFQSMFVMLGSLLCLMVGLIGILNFINAILTGILARKREFAVLQAVGMTGKQLKRMLMLEGVGYTLSSEAAAVIGALALSQLIGGALQQILWFFDYQLNLWPVVLAAPVFLALGVLVPLLAYRQAAKRSVVERLRTE